MTDQHGRSQTGQQVLLSLPSESSRLQGFPASRDAAEPGMEHSAEYWVPVASNALPANMPPWKAARYYAVYTHARIRFLRVFHDKNRHSTSVLAEDLFDRAKLVETGHLVLNGRHPSSIRSGQADSGV